MELELTTTQTILLEVTALVAVMVVLHLVDMFFLRPHRERKTQEGKPDRRAEEPTSPSIQALQRSQAAQQQQINRLEDAAYYQLEELVGLDSDMRQILQLLGGKPRPPRRSPPSLSSTGEHRRPRGPLFPGDKS